MPDKQVEDLKLLLAEEADLEIIEQELEVGEKVLIKAGPFKGIVAELILLRSKKSIVLRLESLGHAIKINTSMAFIESLK
ncbi:MAG: hypothetical protein EOO87_18085 [Pedobacter sp.]|nr:MAG: hypothetical protein EOO87_18085 [Pedobacter sp.]